MTVKDRITITQGDLTEQDVDAVVNAANNDLQLGGGVAGAIARYVIHAASMALGARTTEDNLRASTRNSLLRAKEKGLASIAFPAVGTGIAGFPMRRSAEVMLEEAAGHLRGETSLREVRFVLYDARAQETFREVYDAMEA